jgi:hypothetical protein
MTVAEKLRAQLRFERARLPAAPQKSLKIKSGFSRQWSCRSVFRSLLDINY